MKLKKKILIVPDWVKSVLVDNSKSYKDSIDAKVILSTLSGNDVDIYMAMNMLGLGLTNGAMETFTFGINALPEGLKEAKDLELLSRDFQIRYTIDSGDYASLLIGDLSDIPNERIGFDVTTLGTEYLILTPRVSDTPIDSNELNKSLIEVISNELTQRELYRTPLMKEYLSRL